jgi:hypothetical protein
LDARRDNNATDSRDVEGGRLMTLLKEILLLDVTCWKGLYLVLISGVVEKRSKMVGGWRP